MHCCSIVEIPSPQTFTGRLSPCKQTLSAAEGVLKAEKCSAGKSVSFCCRFSLRLHQISYYASPLPVSPLASSRSTPRQVYAFAMHLRSIDEAKSKRKDASGKVSPSNCQNEEVFTNGKPRSKRNAKVPEATLYHCNQRPLSSAIFKLQTQHVLTTSRSLARLSTNRSQKRLALHLIFSPFLAML